MKWSNVLVVCISIFVCFALLPVLTFSEDISKESITYTPSTETHCIDGKCWIAFYSGTQFVHEDNRWKKIEDAKSLKGIWKKVYLKRDNDYEIEIEDFNYTCIKKLKIKSNVKGDIPFSVDSVEGISLSFEEGEEIEIEDICFDSLLAHTFTLGKASTTIVLQDANTENWADTWVNEAASTTHYGDSPWNYIDSEQPTQRYRAYIKFNISQIPSGQVIEDGWLGMYMSGAAGAALQEVSAYHVISNYTWEDTAEGVNSFPYINWIDQPCGDGFDLSDHCNLTAQDTINVDQTLNLWRNWTVTNAVQVDYDAGNVNLTIAIKATTEGGVNNRRDFNSKENGGASTRPMLNITYSAVPPPVVGDVDLDLFINGTQSNRSLEVGTWVNFTVVANVTGDINLTTDYPDFTPQTNATPLINYTYLDTIGNDFNITGYFEGNASYHPANETWWLNVTVPAAAPVVAAIDYGIIITFITDRFQSIMVR